jgi:hypothetical protein
VARGYWQRPDLTKDCFYPNPFHPGRMYRTGDLSRWAPDGTLDFLGRADTQIKLRGHRIELAEIESVLESQPGIQQAIVVVRADTPGHPHLVAYLRGTTPKAALRSALMAALPAHMVPQAFVTLDTFPLTPNRKIDRHALPAPVAAPKPDTCVPLQGVAQALAAIWSRVLGVPNVGAKDNFFALGGHSLLAVQIHRDIRAELGATKLSITDIFRFPVLDALAAHIQETSGPPVAAQPGDDSAGTRGDAVARRRAMRAAQAAGG